MLRMFRTHELRRVESLDGYWECATQHSRSGRGRLPSRYPERVMVPGTWESIPGLHTYRGTAWFRRDVEAMEDTALQIAFGGVSHTGTVFIDGKRVGGHYDAFTPWAVLAPRLRAGTHELVVEVDNTFGGHSALHIENDYYTYGGITRPVEVHHVPEVCIERLSAIPRFGRRDWTLQVSVVLRNCSRRALERGVSVALRGVESGAQCGVIVPAGKTREVHLDLRAPGVDTWSAQSPRLYLLDAHVLDQGVPVDDCVERVGFREVAVRGTKILLNRAPLTLKGFNRHEDHPSFGCALPPEMMARDLALMKDLGANFVRTSHYPNDMRFLDMCDETGMYVWEESHARNVPFAAPKFREQIAQSTTEMVQWHASHPSIIMWGCLNECDSVSAAGRREYERVIGLLHRLDPSRPVTFASDKARRDICLDLVDIVSWNRYDAWYGGKPENVKPRIEDIIAWLDSKASRGGAGKPLIMSEFGAGAIPGVRNPSRDPWTEEYQCDALDESLRVYLNHPRISGSVIWQFCDVRVTRGWWGGRPRTMNNKGVVDEYRRPKLAYDVVRKRMRG